MKRCVIYWLIALIIILSILGYFLLDIDNEVSESPIDRFGQVGLLETNERVYAEPCKITQTENGQVCGDSGDPLEGCWSRKRGVCEFEAGECKCQPSTTAR